MKAGKFNVVTDGQFGSCGKGLISSYLVRDYEIRHVTSTNMPNAGHTVVNALGGKFIGKALPAPAILAKWLDRRLDVYLGAGHAFKLATLTKEIEETMHEKLTVFIHPRAGVVTDEHAAREAAAGSTTEKIASTMQGCGAMLCDKLMRGKDVVLAQHLKRTGVGSIDEKLAAGLLMHEMTVHLHRLLNSGKTILHEGAQGFSLDINHGLDYPHCTSRQTTAVQNLADMGLPASMMGDVYMVIRPFPIRVGNVYASSAAGGTVAAGPAAADGLGKGVEVGNSGGWYRDQEEVSWEFVGVSPEMTTVTGRQRRVATFSWEQVKLAAMVNGATRIALNFANYIDPRCSCTNARAMVTPKVWTMVDMIERELKIPVTLIGTGPQLNHVVNNGDWNK